MPIRIRFPPSGAHRQVASGRQFSASYVPASSGTGSAVGHSRSGDPVAQENGSHSLDSQDQVVESSISAGPDTKLYSMATRKVTARRPPIIPLPTLALPQSMYPPPPQILQSKSSKNRPRLSIKSSNPPQKTYDIYMKSSDVVDTEPTLEDLDALRPPHSTLHAALDGVIASGRSLLPDGHALHLAVEQLGAQMATVGGGPNTKKVVLAGTGKAKKLEYAALYEAIEGHVSRGFNLRQLRRLEEQSRVELFIDKKMPAEKSISKSKIIHRIMHLRWNMIHPLVIKEAMASENEISDRAYPVSPSELFIFLGKDGENLLHLAKELEMKIHVDRKPSQVPGSSRQASPLGSPPGRPGFVIRANGAAGTHKRLKKHLEEQRSLMTAKAVPLPTGPPLPSTVLHSISRISGAFVENAPTNFAELEGAENSVLITARSPRSAYTAERLVQRAAMEDAHQSQIKLFCLTTSGEPADDTLDSIESSEIIDNDAGYALYPFNSYGLRIRRVQYGADLASTNHEGQTPATDPDEELILTGRSPRNVDGTPIAIDLEGNVVDLSQHMLGGEKERATDERTKITATYGHITFKATNSSTLISPLPQPISRNSVLEWADKQGTKSRRFIPGQIPSIEPSSSSQVLSVHRLQYRTIEGNHILNVDVELPNEDVQPSIVDVPLGREAVNPASPTDRLELTRDGYLAGNDKSVDEYPREPEFDTTEAETATPSEPAEGEQISNEVESAEPPAEAAGEPAQVPTPLSTEITVGTETALELMLPDSATDIYLQLANISPLPKSQVPEDLETYLSEIAKFFTTDVDMLQPDPPQRLSIENKDYILVKNTSSRCTKGSRNNDMPPNCVIATEMSLDLENNLRSTFTELIYDGKGDTGSWGDFMRTCRRLASESYERSSDLRANPT